MLDLHQRENRAKQVKRKGTSNNRDRNGPSEVGRLFPFLRGRTTTSAACPVLSCPVGSEGSQASELLPDLRDSNFRDVDLGFQF